MTHKQMLALRQFVQEVNKLGEAYGHEEMAGTPDDPDPDVIDAFERGLTPEQVIAEAFGNCQPTLG